jgi:hypothetical protein
MNKGSAATHTWAQLTAGIALSTGQRHRIVVPSQELIVRFEIDPKDSAHVADEKFTLIGGTTKDSPRYKQVKTGKDDLIEGDAYLDIKFTRLIPDLKYWLEVDPGNSRPKYMAFAAVPWEQIRQW